jgi:hypothetical protein
VIKIPQNADEWIALGRKAVWAFGRFQILGLIVGALLAVLAQFLTGFWDFRAANEDMLRKQWSEVIDAQEQFESKLAKIDTVLRGQISPTAGTDYAVAAQTYIRSMEAISRSLPETSTQIADYIDAIAALRRYYDVRVPPTPNTEEWLVFYGQYRQDFDVYVAAREHYFNVLANELGDYVRYIASS